MPEPQSRSNSRPRLFVDLGCGTLPMPEPEILRDMRPGDRVILVDHHFRYPGHATMVMHRLLLKPLLLEKARQVDVVEKQGDILNLSFLPNASVHGLHMSNVIGSSYTLDIDAVLAQAARVLKPGRKFYVREKSVNVRIYGNTNFSQPVERTRDELIDLLCTKARQHGLEPVSKITDHEQLVKFMGANRDFGDPFIARGSYRLVFRRLRQQAAP